MSKPCLMLWALSLSGVMFAHEPPEFDQDDVVNSQDERLTRAVDAQSGTGVQAIDRAAQWEKILLSARQLIGDGSYAKAEERLWVARGLVNESMAPDDLGRLSVTYRALGTLRHDTGNYSDAEAFYLRSIQTWEKAYGEADPGLVRLWNDLASLYLDTKQYGKAERICERSSQVQEHPARPVPPFDIAMSLLHAGGLHRALKRYAEAESAYLQAEEILSREGGRESAEAAPVWNNLAVLYAQWKQPAKATAYVARSIARAGERCSPGGALILTNLAVISGENGLAADAERAFLSASDCAMRALGPEHPQTAEVLSRYALFLRKAKRKGEAAQLEAKAHAIREKVAREDRRRFTVDARDLQAANRAPQAPVAPARGR